MFEMIPIRALKDNYIWVIVHPNTKYCVIVDPGDAIPVLNYLEQQQLKPIAILITHHHNDHTGGIGEIVQQHKISVYGPANENIAHLTHPVKENMQISFQELDIQLKALDIPGHTIGHVAYYGNGFVLTSDTLFTAGCGRAFERPPEQLFNSLQKLKQLPQETLIYCGHEYTLANLAFAKQIEPDNRDILERISQSQQLREKNNPTVPATLDLEMKTNPFLRTNHPGVKTAAESYSGHPLKTETEVFAALRQWKNNF